MVQTWIARVGEGPREKSRMLYATLTATFVRGVYCRASKTRGPFRTRFSEVSPWEINSSPNYLSPTSITDDVVLKADRLPHLRESFRDMSKYCELA